MDDLISRQAAIDAVHEEYDEVLNIDESGCYIANGIDDILRSLPSAKPQHIRGRWIPVDSYSAFGGDESLWMMHGNPIAFYCCSVCKEQAYAGEDGTPLLTHFCPDCGAMLEGDDD